MLIATSKTTLAGEKMTKGQRIEAMARYACESTYGLKAAGLIRGEAADWLKADADRTEAEFAEMEAKFAKELAEYERRRRIISNPGPRPRRDVDVVRRHAAMMRAVELFALGYPESYDPGSLEAYA